MVKKIVLSMAAILFALASAFAQNKQLSGTVTGPDGAPVIGATVVVEGTTLGTSTDLQGKYTLSAPTNGVLVVSFIGYEETKIAINGKTTLNVALKEASKAIDDVIVVAFGEAKKDAFTGSAKVVSADDISKTQSASVVDALVGKVAGMQITTASGRPGTTQNSITVRGPGSIYSGTSPLWVVDGMPYEGDINNINPADIESVTVQKDAASNALYGARGANGVIMVTTKRAKVGDARVTFDGKWGLNTRALQTYDYVDDPGEYYALHYQALYNNYLLGGSSPTEAHLTANKVLFDKDLPGGLGYNVMTVPAGQTLIGSNGKLNPNATVGRKERWTDPSTGETRDYWLQPDDWFDALYKPSFRQEYNVNVVASGEKSNFFASFGYLDNEGIITGSSNERYTTRLRADYQAKKWLKVGGNFAYTHYTWKQSDDGEGDGSTASLFGEALNTAPIYPIYIRDGQGNHIYDQYGFRVYDYHGGKNAGMGRRGGGVRNVFQDTELNKSTTDGNAFNANGFAELRIYRDLKFVFNAGVSLDESRSRSILNPYYGQFAIEGGHVSVSHGRNISYNLQQLLNYTHTFGDKHNLDILLGHETFDYKVYSLSASRAKMFSYKIDELSGTVVDLPNTSSSGRAHYNNEGYFVRAQYDFDQRVFVSASYRRDASSNFHPDHRWGNFWSASAAWVINRESWFPQTKVVNLLKLKASYGSQGNDKLGGALYSTYYTDMYDISNDGQGGIATIFKRKGNENITWETNGNLNVGVEFGFWNNRLYGNVDYFYRKTTDMLFSLSVPVSLGYSSYFTNIGDMANQGVEVELGADLIRRKNFVWNFGLNMSHYRNKVTKLPDEYKQHTTHNGKIKGYHSGSSFLAEGYSMLQWYIPVYAGVNEEGKATWYAYKDEADGTKSRYVTDDYNIASEAGRELFDPAAAVYGGFNTSFMFYGVDISANFTYQIGGLAYDSGYANMMTSPQQTSVGNTYHRDLWNAWTPENTNTDIPRFCYNDQYFTSRSTRFFIDASYLNIQNITVGYTLPSKITRKFLVEKLRVYLTCDNVWYWSQRKGLDPRQSIDGSTNQYMYSPIRTFSGGVTITF